MFIVVWKYKVAYGPFQTEEDAKLYLQYLKNLPTTTDKRGGKILPLFKNDQN